MPDAVLQQHQMPLARAFDRAQDDTVVERRQSACARHGERKQVRVGDPVLAEYASPVDHIVGSQAQVGGPKLVIDVAASQFHLAAHSLRSGRATSAVAWHIQHTQRSVFNRGTGRNLQSGRRLEQGWSLGVVHMSVVQQGHRNIDIKKQAGRRRDGHSNSFFVHQAAHTLGGDDYISGGQQRVLAAQRRGYGKRLTVGPQRFTHLPEQRFADGNSFALCMQPGLRENFVVKRKSDPHLIPLGTIKVASRYKFF